MSREPFEAMPDVMDAKHLAEALQISKAGAYNLLSSPDFPTLRIGNFFKIRRIHKRAKNVVDNSADIGGISVNKPCQRIFIFTYHLF